MRIMGAPALTSPIVVSTGETALLTKRRNSRIVRLPMYLRHAVPLMNWSPHLLRDKGARWLVRACEAHVMTPKKKKTSTAVPASVEEVYMTYPVIIMSIVNMCIQLSTSMASLMSIVCNTFKVRE